MRPVRCRTPAPAHGRRGRRGLSAALSLGLLAAVGGAPALTAQEGGLPAELTVDEAIRIALQRSPEVRIAEAEANATGSTRRAAWGAFLPTASVNTSLNRNNFTRTTFLSPEGESQTLPEPLESSSQSASQGLNLSWTVFQQGRRFSELSASGANVRAAQRGLDHQRVTVAAAAARAFYEALRSQRLLELTERQIADRELELEIARRRYEIAAVERIDVLATESNLLDAQVSLARERRQVDAGLRALAVALGLPPEEGPGTRLEDVDLLPDLGAIDSESFVQRALSSDPEILQFEAQRVAASASLWSARSAYLPTIQASLSFGRGQQYGPNASFFQFNPGDTSRGFTLSASWTLFDGFTREQQNAQASAQKRQAEENLRRTRLQIERDVRGYYDELQELSQTLELAERSLAIAQEQLTMTRQMYQNGTIDFTRLQQAISGVTASERQLITLRYDYLIAWTNLNEFGGVR